MFGQKPLPITKMETALKIDSSEESAKAPRVEFAGDVLQQIRQHARSSMRAEICGVLIGNVIDGVTRVTARIAGEGASQGGAHVTFTQDTWEHIYKVKDAEFSSQSIVGWYHSHPGFGIFLSEYDIFIHENFFNAPHQVAWVFDPHSDEEGCFGWSGKKVEPFTEFVVLGKRRSPTSEQTQEEASSRKSFTPQDSSVAAEPGKSRGGAHPDNRISITVIVAILAFVGGLLSRPYFVMFRSVQAPTPGSLASPAKENSMEAPPEPQADAPVEVKPQYPVQPVDQQKPESKP